MCLVGRYTLLNQSIISAQSHHALKIIAPLGFYKHPEATKNSKSSEYWIVLGFIQ